MKLPVLQVIYQTEHGEFHSGDYGLFRAMFRDGSQRWDFLKDIPSFGHLSFVSLPMGIFCSSRERVRKPGFMARLKGEKVWRNELVEMDVDWAKYDFEIFEKGLILQLCVAPKGLSAHKILKGIEILKESDADILRLYNRFRKPKEQYTSVVSRHICIEESESSRSMNVPFSSGPMIII